ncbi:hypothetical protein AUK40_06190 [Candidatus Wirthbacteria bacterium CG2_30_54_11]|uniref:Uncharacterized protein n=1 Tax=Candidatus Wirthbacteria bacterium CG2_30_54_11 TaxID=1817892 RepID=A0A1J5ILQ4_9BACT|nr:MAG: hypothetical protein AUK40_06190 [Candidatus Wirthbacteria bacterium CG2_30_54_11]
MPKPDHLLTTIFLVGIVFYGGIFVYLHLKGPVPDYIPEVPVDIYTDTSAILACNTYGISNCPSACGVCPPTEASSALVCEALNMCLWRGFDIDWQSKARSQTAAGSTRGSEYGSAYWSEVLGFLGAGMVQGVTQRPGLEAVIHMTDGTKKIALEPSPDAIYAAVEECGTPCAQITEVME